MKKIYTAPEAEIMLLVPEESIAASWSDNNSSWKTDGLFWKQNDLSIDVTSGTVHWYEFGLDEIKPITPEN